MTPRSDMKHQIPEKTHTHRDEVSAMVPFIKEHSEDHQDDQARSAWEWRTQHCSNKRAELHEAHHAVYFQRNTPCG
jgi:hypothetical protein